MRSDDNFVQSLFSKKENYAFSCTHTGKLWQMMSLSKSERRKKELHNLHLMEGMSFTQNYGFPIIEPYKGTISPMEMKYVPFSTRNDVEVSQNVTVTFFEDDYKFVYSTWNNLDRTTYKLRVYNTLLTPDHSLYVDMPDAFNIYQVYCSRFAGAYWQNCGFNVIPTASWGSVDTFKYCFLGLPHNSVIAVCGIGVDWCAAAQELWCMAIRELILQLSPTLIIVYGKERIISGVSTPILFIPPFYKSKLNEQHTYGTRK